MRKVFNLVFAALLLASCSTTKKATTYTSQTRDSAVAVMKIYVRDSVYVDRVIERHDTVIQLQGLSVSNTLPGNAMEQAHTKDGKPVARKYTIDTAGIHAWLMLNPDGSVSFGAWTDTRDIRLAQLVKVYESRIATLQARTDSISAVKQSKEVTWSQYIQKNKSFFARYWPVMLGAAVLLVIAEIVHTYRKRKLK
jgi:hypothetical protein